MHDLAGQNFACACDVMTEAACTAASWHPLLSAKQGVQDMRDSPVQSHSLR